MTRLQQVTAVPHPGGYRIDVSWVNSNPAQYPLVRVVRRQHAFPTGPDDGYLVDSGTGAGSVTDTGLKAETAYYYTLFPGDRAGTFVTDEANRVVAMATGAYNMAGIMYDLTPAIYHRYDTVFPPAAPNSSCFDPADANRGQLRRFLDLPGGQLDQFYSYARSLLDLLNLDRVDGRLLPLLAQWVGWNTDYRLGYDQQRNELRHAPTIYQRVGIVPTVEATIKRLLGWESRTKEFVHNVFLSNQPERLNLWAIEWLEPGRWTEPQAPLSLDYSFEGRPALTRDAAGRLWLFYHTQRNGRWDIWTKTLTTLTLAGELETDLRSGHVTNRLRAAFSSPEGLRLAETATIQASDEAADHGRSWQIRDPEHGLSYAVKVEVSQDGTEQLVAYHWSPSAPLTGRPELIDRHPAACTQGGTIWLFWDAYDAKAGKSELYYSSGNGSAAWSRSWRLSFGHGSPESNVQREEPAAVVDDQLRLWLFWLERNGRRRQLKYNGRDGTGWLSPVPFPFPPEVSGGEPQVDADPFALYQPAGSNTPARLWLFWARRVAVLNQSRQTRWQVAYRVAKLVDQELEWGPVQTLPGDERYDDGYSDREPAALLDVNGVVELFWSSNRDRSWSIWQCTLEDLDTGVWSQPLQVTSSFYSQRAPLAYTSPAGGLRLLYRANDSVSYQSTIYQATRSVDFRYAGATTVDSRNTAKNRRRGRFHDFQSYTSDAGRDGQRGEQEWYGRDTVGLYLTPTSEDPAIIARNRQVVQDVLQHFLPIQVRAVLIIEPAPHREAVYTYDFLAEPAQRRLGETAFDSVLPETVGAARDSHIDWVAGWTWIHSWAQEFADHRTLDLTSSPVDTRNRTWHTGLNRM
jgi:hypothetical protein